MSPASENCTPPRRVRRNGGLVIPHAPRWHQRAGAWAVFALVRAVAGTIRCRYRDRSGFLDGTAGPAIYCIWHNRLALCMKVYHDHVVPRNQTAGLAAMVSASKDGAFLASILECFKVQPVRGSSSRRGPQALLELTTWAERGYDLAITPDGPRGPCYVVQEGVMSLAQLTGLPILPVSYHLDWRLRLKSWDRFQVPLPFAQCEVVIERPVRVPREASDAQREGLRRQLEETLKGITKD
ncbi:MAG: lysophospholipid acyltransferase family protein [Verrucomicrobiota bacterium]